MANVSRARELSTKLQLALRLIKRRVREVLEPGFHAVFDAAIRYHRTTYGAGEPQDIGEKFLARRGSRLEGSKNQDSWNAE